MTEKTITITNEVGLHARAATLFIKKANDYKSSVWVESAGRQVNAKSLLGVLSLGIIQNTEIKIIADGVDENDAIAGLISLIDSGFMIKEQ